MKRPRAIFTFVIADDDDREHDLPIDSRDVVKWERHTGRPYSDFNPGSQTDLYVFAWLSARRLKLFSGELEAFEETYLLRFDDDDEEVGAGLDPTPAAASTDSPSK